MTDSMTADEYRALRRNANLHKYGAVRTEYNGRSYPSKAEARRAAELDVYLKAGVIKSWKPQPVFRLGCPENKYVADFLVEGKDGRWWAEDVKGVNTKQFRHNLKLWKAYGPFDLVILYAAGRKRWDSTVYAGGLDKAGKP